jgi:ABC-2 type transport system permease protein
MTTWLATHRGLRALSGRETARVLKLWTQTILAPILSSALFIVVFGLSLGDRIREIDGFPYDQYIVPGLIAMSMAQAAYANNSATVFQARFDRYLNDVLAAPMRGWEVNLGLNLGGALRSRSCSPSSARSAWSSACTPSPGTTRRSSPTS